MKTPTSAGNARAIFARNLRRARQLRKISQEALAIEADLSRTYVSEVERCMRNISIDNMEMLALGLRVPLKDLVDPDKFRDLD